MFTLAKESTKSTYSLLSALPERIREQLKYVDTDRLLELRLRLGGRLCAVSQNGCFFVTSPENKDGIIVNERDIKRALELITNFSMYAYENEIKNGFVTLPGGHRVGICGEACLSDGKITHLKSIQALNYRFAREFVGCSDGLMDRIAGGGFIKNTVIVSPPMYGKTTLLRDIARNLSLMGKRVSIVDERGEIASLHGGFSPFDLGYGCDVLSGTKKADGMLFMLRSMSPDVIITDEIGDSGDFSAIAEIKRRGVSIITSIHGKNITLPEFDETINLKGIGIYA
ncbi:MAG: stage III sporulation protein AA [Clostridia bacterium]|nr:stage III sporulation protein AA [Clostridia bacterium]